MDQYTLGIKPVRKKPVQVYAAEITRTNCNELVQWIKDHDGKAEYYDPERRQVREHNDAFWVQTWEGWVIAKIGDYLIKGTEGEFYPIKKQVYYNCYEDVPRDG